MTQHGVYVSNIQRFSVDDGPGIRTTVFLMGCNLRCPWCHNPECIHARPQPRFFSDRCTLCGRCLEVCPRRVHSLSRTEAADGTLALEQAPQRQIRPELCAGCRACEKACPSQALQITGRLYTPEEVLAVVERDRPYYEKSGGGLTVSGGEPMLHRSFLKKLLKAARGAGLSTAVDTAGQVTFRRFQQMAPLTDLFLFDLKIFDPRKHLEVVGQPNRRILANLINLSDLGARLIVRVPVIPPISTLEDLGRVAEFLAPLRIELVQLLPYHQYGQGKYSTLGLEYRLADQRPPAPEFMTAALDLFKARGLNASIN